MNDNYARKQYLAAKLAAHTATEAERDEALGTILLSLWGHEDVERMIADKHNELCKECPVRKASEKGSFKERITMELVKILGWAIIIIGVLAGAARYIGGNGNV